MKRIQESIIILSLLDEDLKNRDETIISNQLHFAQFQTNTQAAHHYISLFNMSLITSRVIWMNMMTILETRMMKELIL